MFRSDFLTYFMIFDLTEINRLLLLLCIVFFFLLSFGYMFLPWWFHRRANNAFLVGKYIDAAKFFKKAVQLAPRDAKLLFGYGVALIRLGRRDQALIAFDKAERLAPLQDSVLLEKITVLRSLKRLNICMEELTKRINLGGDSEQFRLLRSAIEIDLFLFHEAIQDCDYLIEHGSENVCAEAFNNRGVANLLLGLDTEAEADFSTSYLLDPRSSTVRAYCAGVWLRRNQPKKAFTLCEATIKTDPFCGAAFYYRGLAKKALGDNVGFYEDLQKAEELDCGFTRFS